MMTLLTITAWAGTVTLDLAAQGYANAEDVTTVTGNGATLTFAKATGSNAPKYYTTGTAVRMYNGNTLTIEASNNITAIEFTCVSGYDCTGTFDCGSYTSPNWECGEATTSTVVYTCGSSQTRIQKIVVTVDDGAQQLAAPTVLLNGEAPKSTYSTEELPLTLTITSNNGTESPKMVYSLSSNYEDAQSGIVSSATLELGDDAVYGLKVGDNSLHVQEVIGTGEDAQESLWTTVNFTITEPAQAITSLAVVNALADNTEFTYGATVTVVGQTGQYLYVQDDNAGTLIYGSAGQSYNFGDIIPAGWNGKKVTFKGAPEVTNPANLAAATENVAPTAIELTPAQVTLENFGRYAVIRGATINGNNIVVGDQTVASYNRFGVNAPTTGTVFDIYGVCGYYNNVQFMPLEYVDVTPVSEELIITMTPGGTFYKPVEVTISVNNEDALISYKLNGGEDIDYEGPFTLNETTTVSVYATDGDQEAIAEETYTIDIPTSLAVVNAFENNTEFTYGAQTVVMGSRGKNMYIVMPDNTAGAMIYDASANWADDYTFGKVINAGWSGKKATYRTKPEVANPVGFELSDQTAEVTPIEITAADLTLANFGRYAVVKNAEVIDGGTITDVTTYDQFNATTDITAGTYDVYGVIGWDNNAGQFMPLEYVEATTLAKNIISYFVPENCEMAVTAADGSAIVSGETEVTEGDVVTITIIPDADYSIKEVKVTEFELRADGDNVPVTEGETEGVYTFVMPANPVSIQVTLEEIINTAISDINAASNGAVKYVSPTGQVSNRPFEGINIVIEGNKVTKMVK